MRDPAVLSVARPGAALPEVAVPPEIARYAAEPPQLGVGRPGKVGVLQVELAPVGGVTRIVRSFHRVPLQVLKALYCDYARPDQAFVYVASPTGGILQGDRLFLEVVARPGSRVHVTTQAMTKVYRMAYGYAVQHVRLRAEAESYLEYLPDPTIPYQHARFYQEIVLEKAPGATLLAWDILLPGRVAAAEAFAYDVVGIATTGRALDGTLLFRDVMLLEPGRRDPRTLGLLGPYPVVGSLFVLSDAVPAAALAEAMAAAVPPGPAVALGASTLPNGSGAVARVLSTTAAGAQQALAAAWAAVRRPLLGEGLPALRKY
jgi:urease accessory protein